MTITEHIDLRIAEAFRADQADTVAALKSLKEQVAPLDAEREHKLAKQTLTISLLCAEVVLRMPSEDRDQSARADLPEEEFTTGQKIALWVCLGAIAAAIATYHLTR